MPFKTILSVCSGLIFVLAFFPYIKAILRRETSPRKATWLVWALGDVVILIGMIAKGTTSGLMIGAVLGAVTTFVLSLKFGESGWNRRDKVCITLSMIAIALWIYFGESDIGIGLSLIALVIAAWPTYVSAWENPGNEDSRGWILFNTANVFAVLAIPSLTFADMASPFTFMAIDIPMLFLLFVRPRLQEREIKRLLNEAIEELHKPRNSKERLFDLVPDLQEEWYLVEQEANVGKDREQAKVRLEAFLAKLKLRATELKG